METPANNKQTKSNPQIKDKPQMKGYDKTDRDFQNTDEDKKSDEREKTKLRPEQYPVNNESSRGQE